MRLAAWMTRRLVASSFSGTRRERGRVLPDKPESRRSKTCPLPFMDWQPAFDRKATHVIGIDLIPVFMLLHYHLQSEHFATRATRRGTMYKI